jgi:carbamoyl-phosphate synthase large subunit
MVGRKLAEFGLEPELPVRRFFVKSPVFPFQKFPGADTILGPEMKSTGEVMGVADNFGLAFAKAQLAAHHQIPTSGQVFVSVNDRDKPQLVPIARELVALGITLVATRGTVEALRAAGLPVKPVFKVNEGRPNVVDLIKSASINLIINTPLGRASRFDEKAIRRAAVQHGVTCITTLSAASAAINGIRALREGQIQVASLQELHKRQASVVINRLSAASKKEH